MAVAVVVLNDGNTHPFPFSSSIDNRSTTTTVRWWCGGYNRERDETEREKQRRSSAAARGGGSGDSAIFTSSGLPMDSVQVSRSRLGLRSDSGYKVPDLAYGWFTFSVRVFRVS
ncbi:hypothetical protein Hdeb2414_s0005g00158351 [Helianthus debilis subsp. tardiflorus]